MAKRKYDHLAKEALVALLMEWLVGSGIPAAHINTGQTGQSGANVRFNGKLRVECLSL